ncbi:ATP-dependent protease ClpP protease subunit [Paenochrobactrum gallinarii]|uniref:ATP-dependent Clp protease proteolytic subunit n=1 Tax=Paenochrobactrum gallinarii TaxID=643673 RepID=A0A841LYF4_9HYPH|nr:head maturation protease, ClpP-related [Paenochrobactrum gallinarii]MBB6262426.1 ATP-dependent protease ClpP protease subunit [Paenochrobactrum gallinarii]
MARDPSDATISILDVIGEDSWSGGGVTSKRIAAALRSIGDDQVQVDINSPGGDFFEGVAIYNLLRAHPNKVTVRILGIAASAASVIAMAGDEIQIGKAGFLMVHNAWVLAVGNRHDLAEAAKTMQPFDDAMATVYADRAGVDKATAIGWMDNETWFSGAQAIETGLADSYLSADTVIDDKARADSTRSIHAARRVDALLARTGMTRSERRALLAEVKGGKQDAAVTVMHDADDLKAAIEQLRSTIRS